MNDQIADIHFPGLDRGVSRVGFGCSKMLWPVKDNEKELNLDPEALAERAIETALEEGITLFDHADVYQNGEPEEQFGRWLKKNPGLREKIFIQTKCGIVRDMSDAEDKPYSIFDYSKSHVLESVEGSLRRLQTDYIDILLLHQPDLLVEPVEIAETFDQLHREGKVKTFGLCNSSAGFISVVSSQLKQPVAINQIQLSLVNYGVIEEDLTFNRAPGDPMPPSLGTLDYCRLNNVTLQCWAPVGRVMMQTFAKKLERWQKLGEVIERIAGERSVSREAVCLAWLLRHPATVQPIIGSRKPQRIRDCLQGISLQLTRREWYDLFMAARERALLG